MDANPILAHQTIAGRQESHDADAGRNTISLPKFFMIVGQLALLLLIVRQFQIESSAFLRVFILVIAGFVVHYFLPFRLRIHWFLAMSLASIVVVMGAANSAWLIGIGVTLVTLCHLPIDFGYRVALVTAAGATLAGLRAAPIVMPFSGAVWPILGSIFMYRTIVYMYDLKHGRVPEGISHRLAFFFMLPNVCFPLFPVIDSNDFRRLHYSAERHHTYQTGVAWITRGIIHLLIYRYVYYHLTISPADVLTPTDLAQFLVANFLLYLKVSGLFHLVIGILHLFGFALPETHKLYYLSSSFTDFWRRINIYWKDFMMKVFYYPIYFQLKRRGDTFALVVSTLLVFVLTWMLHSYQWFWLRGTFPIEWQDGAFWGILAVLVVINSVREIKVGRKRQLGQVHWYSYQSVVKSCKVLAIFVTICSLWSLWTCESLESWLAMWGSIDNTEDAPLSTALFLLSVVGLVLLISVVDSSLNNSRQKQLQQGSIGGVFGTRQIAVTIAPILFLAVIGLPQFYTGFGADTANFVLSLRSDKLSRTDAEKLEKGYYEDLVRVDRFNSQLWEVYAKKPVEWLEVNDSGLKEYTDDFLQYQLPASTRSNTEHGVMTTNKWGMRDQHYELLAPTNSFRIAMLGASTEMGWGVRDGETFEAILEGRLNDVAEEIGYDSVEILNFGTAGYKPLQQRMKLERALEFRPDAVYYVASGREYRRAAQYLQEAISVGVDIPYPYLMELASRVDVDSSTPETEALRRLAPYREELLQWLYNEIVKICLQNDVQPVWIFMPQAYTGHWEDNVDQIVEEAREAGFTTLNLMDVYADYPLEGLQLTEWDFHPNSRGHQIIADRLFTELVSRRQSFFDKRR